jgi:hypothetical protein
MRGEREKKKKKKREYAFNILPQYSIIFLKIKFRYSFLRLGTLGSLIEFKHMVALTNETQIMLSFPRIFKFNIFEFN